MSPYTPSGAKRRSKITAFMPKYVRQVGLLSLLLFQVEISNTTFFPSRILPLHLFYYDAEK